MRDHPLMVGAREADDLSAIGVESQIRQAGLKPEDVMYVAEQRALRMILFLVRCMNEEQIKQYSAQTEGKFALSTYEKYLYRMFITAEMDGIIIGWRANQQQQTEKP